MISKIYSLNNHETILKHTTLCSIMSPRKDWYDYHFRKRNPYNARTPPVLNPDFFGWTSFISECFSCPREGSGEPEEIQYELLTWRCHIHAQSHNRSIASDNAIVLVHPFYLFTNHFSELKGQKQRDAKTYWNNLMMLFHESGSSDDRSIVVFDTPHHYAAVTSLLLQDRLIDHVFFTDFDRGTLLERETDLDYLKNKTIYLGGGYRGICLKHCISEVLATLDSKKVQLITDLALYSPLDREFLLDPWNGHVRIESIRLDALVDLLKNNKEKPTHSHDETVMSYSALQSCQG